MAYSGNNLDCTVENMNGSRKWWKYESADAIGTVRAAGYISDAVARGMVTRDIVWVLDTVTPATYIATVTITAGVATIGTGITITE